MVDAPDNLVLEHLRAMRGDLVEIKADLVEMKERVGMLETQYASLSRRIDHMVGEVCWIKRLVAA